MQHGALQEGALNTAPFPVNAKVMELLQDIQTAQLKLLSKASEQHDMLESLAKTVREVLPAECGLPSFNRPDAVFSSKRHGEDDNLGGVLHKQNSAAFSDFGDVPRSVSNSTDPTRTRIARPRIETNPGALSGSIFEAPEGANRLTRFALGPFWAILCAVMIVLNTVIVGFETQFATDEAFNVESAVSYNKDLMDAFELCFLAWMIFELLVNLYAQKSAFLLRKHLAWNVFDAVLIVFAIIMQIESIPSSWGFMRIVRLVRFGKILRLLRIIRYLSGIRTMIISLVASTTPLLSAFGVMTIFMYVVSLLLMQGLVHNVQEVTDPFEVGRTAFSFWGPVDEATRQQTIRLYGSIGRTMMTLFMTISGGMDWGDAAEPVAKLDVYLSILWIVYSAFMTFGLTNILVGIFVESALQSIQNDKASRMTAEIDNYAKFVERLKAIFSKADDDADGTLSRTEFEFLLRDPDLVQDLKVLGIESQVDGLFRFLDQDKTDCISFEEFEAGLWRIKGEASAVDMLMLMHEHRRTAQKISRLTHDMGRLRSSVFKSQPAFPPALSQLGVVGSRVELLDDGPWLTPWSVKQEGLA